MGTALITTNGKGKGRAIARFDMSRFDPVKMAERANRFSNAVGAGDLSGSSRFPGMKYTYSSGIWYKGVGKKKSALPRDTEFVVNALQMASTWVRWEDQKPRYLPDMYHLADGQEMPARDTLGDTDPEEWDTDDKGQPQDPWKPVLVIPVRDEDEETINHIEFTTKSSVRVGFDLFRSVAESMVSHMGELPLVRLGTQKAEMERDVVKTKKDKKTGKAVEYTEKVTHKWDTPVLEIVGWAEMKDCDDPNNVASEASDDVGEVEARERKSKVKPEKAKPSKRKARVVEDDDEDDDNI